MMMTPAVEAALNEQMNLEFFSFYSYLAMAAHADSLNLKGMARWLQIQAHEELEHAMKIYHFLLQRNASIQMRAIGEARSSFASIVEIFETAYANEERVTRSIDDLVTLSIKQQDHATNTFLQWFVSEQVEELSIVDEALQSVRLVENNGGALFILDRDLGKRTNTGEPDGEST